LHLYVAYLSDFKRGGESKGVCNLICRPLFHYYGNLFYYSTVFPSEKRGDSKKEGERVCVKGRERRRRRRRRRRRKGTSLPLKTDLTLVIYKILEKTPVL
jgi:hypothetical protein